MKSPWNHHDTIQNHRLNGLPPSPQSPSCCLQHHGDSLLDEAHGLNRIALKSLAISYGKIYRQNVEHIWNIYGKYMENIWKNINVQSYGYESIPINTIFRGMNIHKSQLFWCELQGYKVLTHCHMENIWKHVENRGSMAWIQGTS